MMYRGILGQEAFAGRGDIGMPQVRKNDGRSVGTWMRDDADTYLVGTAFQSYRNHGGCRRDAALMFVASGRGDVGRS
jgi:hypothetical protein